MDFTSIIIINDEFIVFEKLDGGVKFVYFNVIKGGKNVYSWFNEWMCYLYIIREFIEINLFFVCFSLVLINFFFFLIEISSNIYFRI